MDEDLHFSVGNRYSIALLVFFITYFLFELPATLAMRWVGPRLLVCISTIFVLNSNVSRSVRHSPMGFSR